MLNLVLGQSNIGVKMSIGKSKLIRYEESPFTKDMIIPKKGRYVKLSRLGRDDNVLVNNATGEYLGTHVTTIKQVDSEQFVKLFTANIALTFDLTSAGIKALNVLVWEVQRSSLGKDTVYLDTITMEQFLKINNLKLSRATFTRGLKELEMNKIIARAMRQGDFFLNPNFIFNGDRIAFTTLIERKKTEVKDTKTIDMFE